MTGNVHYDPQEMDPKILFHHPQILQPRISSNYFFSQRQSLHQTPRKSPLLLLLFPTPLSALHSSNFFIPKNLEPLQTVSGISIAVLLDAAFLKA